ncbi:CaiB/BaiF CoA-transferase family protein [Bradyrhizobium sp. LHD-71]|uniref:CaiB/BaiF CoA transferase family protein n=1 Tax=Bradyrhizobium sp. LHD-71 TaxID=3072141 RepID=UPI0028109BC8|nr:CaiB/BaiF CoA-transferase family protein [Bradyrhizobium sp. LHD-71]MDQ8727910.1 CaiB/BaiF CoA-transferase family protein [Bradyrhizobium sp. LHD-71]
MRPFEGIRVIDATHVLAGPFASYQLALFGADVIKVEDPNEPDQSRMSGSDRQLSRDGMGIYYLSQGSNKRSVTLNLKTEGGREAFKRLIKTADVLVENYRPGAFDALGLGYEALTAIQPRLIYCSISAFGQDGPRGKQTAYDFVIQATTGLMAMTGTREANPIKIGAPAIDYATGTMAAFALASALFQRERTNKSQHIDLAMNDVAFMLAASHVAGYLRTGHPPTPNGNDHPHATNCCYQTRDGLLMLGASNLRQQKRLWTLLGRPDMAKANNDQRHDDKANEMSVLAELLRHKTADEWEAHLQANHVPAARVRTLPEALSDPQIASREFLHQHRNVDGVDGGFTVPVAAFKLAHGTSKVTSAPRALGADTDAVLKEIGYDSASIARLRAQKSL